MAVESKSGNKGRLLLEKGLTFFHKGEYESAAEVLREAIIEDPQAFEAIYNLSCCYSMMGQKDNALTYFHRATQIAPQCADWAKEDREFDPIREDPVFQEMLAVHAIDNGNGQNEEAAVKEPVNEPEVDEDVYDGPVEADELNDLANEDFGGESQPSTPPPASIKKAKAKKEPEPSPFPPCATCGGIVETERRNKNNVLMILMLIWVGIMLCISMFIWVWGMIGFPIIVVAFYLLIQTREVWVCQNCGAAGVECGQPPDELKK